MILRVDKGSATGKWVVVRGEKSALAWRRGPEGDRVVISLEFSAVAQLRGGRERGQAHDAVKVLVIEVFNGLVERRHVCMAYLAVPPALIYL